MRSAAEKSRAAIASGVCSCRRVCSSGVCSCRRAVERCVLAAAPSRVASSSGKGGWVIKFVKSALPFRRCRGVRSLPSLPDPPPAMLRARPTALCLLWLSPYTRALSVPPRRPPPSPRGRRAAEGNYGRRPARGQPAGGGGGWRPSAQSSSPSWDDEEYEDEEQLPEAPDGEFLFGVNPVLAALKQRRRKMYRLLVQARPCAWDVCGMCVACARRVHGMCTACARYVHGVCMP